MIMGLWKSLFGKLKSDTSEGADKDVPEEFREWVKRSIQLIGNNPKNMENEELHNYLVHKGIPEFEAGEIIIFLPIAFCRELLPNLNWSSIYYDCYSDGKRIKRKFRKNERYLIIDEETKKYWNRNPNNDVIIQIAGRSAEFKVINELLLVGGKLEDVKLTNSYIMR